MPRILLVEDDRVLREAVAAHLRACGYEVTVAADGEAAIEAADSAQPDVVLLDVMLPGLGGRDVMHRLRGRRPDLPVILVTARGQEHERVQGLQWGADDYVPKPFSLRELELRVRSLLRRSNPAPLLREVRSGDLVLDLAARTAFDGRTELQLTGREFDLLAYVAARPGLALSRADLMREVWGWDSGDDSTVTVHVRRLREKLEPEPSRPVRLVTVFGVGYRWDHHGP